MNSNSKKTERAAKRSTLLHGLAMVLFAVLAGLGAQDIAHAQDAYPNKPLRLIVPYPPGGVTDNASLLIAERLGREVGERVLVDNKTGPARSLA